MEDLLKIRDEIDKVDTEIAKLYEKRMHLTEEVAEYKIANNKPVLDRDRELEKLEKLKDMVSDVYNKRNIVELFEQIMSMSRKRQYRKLSEKGIGTETGYNEVDCLPTDGATIVFQGTEGAYSELAMKAYFGKDIKNFSVSTFRDAMEAIRSGEADYAVLPIENSSAGIVSENYDLLVEYNNSIVGEQIIKIEHVLLGLQDAELTDITDVYSHPQALMQCSKYLDYHRSWEVHTYQNTALAAKKICDDEKKNKAAIANAGTADLYNLKILAKGFQNNVFNSTKFIVVSGKKVYEKGADKISICFELHHNTGSLYRALSHFIYNGLNMTKIESRPAEISNWEYRFFVDFEGNLNDAAVKNALRGLKEETINLMILGNYKGYTEKSI